MKFDTCLFDADGTILDTAELIKKCFHNTLNHFGAEPQTDETIMSHVGLPFLQQAEYYLGPLTQDQKMEVWEYHRNYQLEIHADYLKECPGVKSGLKKLEDMNVKLGIVTSRNHHTLDIYLNTLGIKNFFKSIITPEDVNNPKPHGEPAIKALNELNSEAKKTLFIGDAVYDQQCALNANIKFVYVDWSHIPFDRFKPVPDYRINSTEKIVDLL